MSAFWQQAERIVVPANGTATFTLKPSQPLESLTLWATSGPRTIANMTFQPKVNGVNLGSSSNVTAAVAAKVIYSSGGGDATSNNNLLPFVTARDAPTLDPFVLTVLLTNAGLADDTITMYGVGTVHTG